MVSGDLTANKVVVSDKGCAMFDGTDDKLQSDTADYRSSDNAGTITAWVITGDNGTSQAVFGTADTAGDLAYLYLGINPSGNIEVSFRFGPTPDTVSGTTTSLLPNTWYHFALTSSGSAYKLYVNGTAQTLSVISGSNAGKWFNDVTGRDNVTISSVQRNSPFGYWNGGVNEVRVYSSELSAADISTLASGGEITEDLVSQWRLGEGELTDNVGSVDMTATGAYLTTTRFLDVRADVELLNLAAVTDNVFVLPVWGRDGRFHVFGVNREA